MHNSIHETELCELDETVKRLTKENAELRAKVTELGAEANTLHEAFGDLAGDPPLPEVFYGRRSTDRAEILAGAEGRIKGTNRTSYTVHPRSVTAFMSLGFMSALQTGLDRLFPARRFTADRPLATGLFKTSFVVSELAQLFSGTMVGVTVAEDGALEVEVFGPGEDPALAQISTTAATKKVLESLVPIWDRAAKRGEGV